VDTIKMELCKLPHSPGVYLFKDEKGEIIYIGKAKDIRKRVSQYFRSLSNSPKTKLLVSKINSIDFICTSSEKEALLLEFSLIKKHRPRFNIVLRDDKAYLLFKLDLTHPYPRIQLTRKITKKNNCKYFGPYTSAKAARETLKLINKIFPLRKCKDSIFRNRTRPCLQYHINRCLGPCCLEVDKNEYMELIKEVEMFLKGKDSHLISNLEKKMWDASEKYEFEKAAQLRDRILKVKKTLEQQRVIFPKGGDLDVIAIEKDKELLGIGILFIRSGKVIDHKNFVFDKEKLNFLLTSEKHSIKQEILRSFLYQFYSLHPFIPEKILLPCELKDVSIEEFLKEKKGKSVELLSPRTNLHRDLLRLATINIFKKQIKNYNELLKLSKILGISNIPKRIEIIDCSHMMGKQTMVGQIVFEDGNLKKEDYRIYRFSELDDIKDDYLALRRWAKKRFASGPPWPDLLIIDGGKGQLNVVKSSFQEEFNDSLPFKIIAIAKGKRTGDPQDKIYIHGRKNPLSLKKGSKELLFIQFLRDNAHRFVITRMKKSFKKKSLESSIEKIAGVGPKTAKILWNHFNTLEHLLSASIDDLIKVPGIGKRRAEQIYSGLQKIKEQVNTYQVD
jgi:excinuclease ABC subunit C